MQQIYLSGNPFTKTHATTYRMSIFNFFRATPGFTEDISIDNSPPGIVERRNLKDRVQEKPPPLPAAQRLQSPPPLHRQDLSMENETLTLGRNTRKKKTNRMRIVSLDDRKTPALEEPRRDLEIGGTRDINGDEYRRRLEALREEAGTGWLRVLSESGGLTEKGVKEGGRT
jgi:hypothetical protein